MAEDRIQKLMDLACVDRDEAIDLLNKSGNDVIEALSLKMNVPPGRDAPKPRELSMIQQFFKETRDEITKLTESISKGFAPTSSDQSEHSEPVVTQNLLEGTAPQSNCYSECHLPSLISEVQIPEIAYLSLSGCSSGSPSSVQKLCDSDQGCPQSCPCPEKVSSETGAETIASAP